MMRGSSITVAFAMEKTTPGTIRYQEVDETGNAVKGDTIKVGTLYVKKRTLGSEVPQRLLVQITAQ